MYNRYETTLDAHLAQLLGEKLGHAMQARGFKETLHLAEPEVREFQRGFDVVTLQVGHVGGRDRTISLESESLDVSQLVEAATRNTVLEVSARLIGALPWIDGARVLSRMDSLLAEVLQEPR